MDVFSVIAGFAVRLILKISVFIVKEKQAITIKLLGRYSYTAMPLAVKEVLS